ncbi:TetR/AcrR family transcriptional regulator [Shewanella sp.]|uniref:TetR/AcrR family transcriptional regulator n=1 Tax=Shewanella sp. TaxID=50422 RepID=UPI003A9870B0
MARPLSEKKREAILTAAAELIATSGTGASTANIAKAAGVAEGTLFTYFTTKDDLLNQLFLEIETDLAQTVMVNYPVTAGSRERIYHIWNQLIDWGVTNPTWRKVLRQLKVSDRITDESWQLSHNLFRESRALVEQAMTEHVAPERLSFYIDTVLIGLADMTIDAIAASPKPQHEHFIQSGFDLYWNGTAR